MGKVISIYDTTLRDGAQGEEVSFSAEDKWKIARALDDLGLGYIEAGNPASNPKDLEFFRYFEGCPLKNAVITAFGSTRRKDLRVEEDMHLKALLSANTRAVAIFGKSWDFHVTHVIRTSLDENLRMIEETVRYFKNRDREVIFDAEHFFDGYKANPDYALRCLEAAAEGGAAWLVLCDTNGGGFPDEVQAVTRLAVGRFSLGIGVHCHDDGGMAAANSVMAVEAGATQVQGTFIGFGERCGNANLSTVIPNLQLKKGYRCIPRSGMADLTETARLVAEVSNIALNPRFPYVGRSAFAHKGGMHIDGVSKKSRSFEHIPPEKVGNRRRFLMSEVGGRSMILKKLQEIAPDLEKDSAETRSVVERLKSLEHDGYQFEAAECSFELMVRRLLGRSRPFFELENFTVIGEMPTPSDGRTSTALIKVKVGGDHEMTAAEGDGPVHALDRALRKALGVFYPELNEMKLTDFKVRVLNPQEATAAKVRVLIESTDGRDIWTTVGVSTDIIEASCLALVDSIEYKLMRQAGERSRAAL
ncbi:MAG: citramalate synthase [Candidatus Aminicenantes bacterium RBG_16_63_16]|nr:MAG: citramalate synthase [Candidatus Aminicenantes bacterium RBG_16_63_16]